MRSAAFTVEAGMLLQSVTPAKGRPYRHACTIEALTAVAHAIDEADNDGIGMEAIRTTTGLPWTQIAVAAAFMLERGCIAKGFRRRYVPTSGDTFLDAMTEYHALREEPATPPA